MEQFTNDQLDKGVAQVGIVIGQVREQNPVAADAILQDPKLQLGIADYKNQFGSTGPQFIGYLAGNPQQLAGGSVQTGASPTREDIQTFIGATAYGQNPQNASGIAGREAHFNEAMSQLDLGAAIQVPNRTLSGADPVLRWGSHGSAVHELQTKLAGLGYKDGTGQPLTADGSFGPATDAAVKSFQRDQGLTDDGVVGPTTQRVLNEHVQTYQRPQGAQQFDRSNEQQSQMLGRLDDPGHPDHSFFQQAREHVHRLDRALGRTPDQQSDNLASALTVQARVDGLQRIDQVALGVDGHRLWAVQVPPGRTDHLFDRRTSVPTAAVNTSMEQSAARWPQAMQQFQQTQDQSQAQAAQAQTQTQAQQQAMPGPRGTL